MKNRLCVAGLACVVVASLCFLGCEQAGDSVSSVDDMDCLATCSDAGDGSSCTAGCPGAKATSDEAMVKCGHEGCPADCAVHTSDAADAVCPHADGCCCAGNPEGCKEAHEGTCCAQGETPCEAHQGAIPCQAHQGEAQEGAIPCQAHRDDAGPVSSGGGCPMKAAGKCPGAAKGTCAPSSAAVPN